MEMNRQQKRMLRKQGELAADGSPDSAPTHATQRPPVIRCAEAGHAPMQFLSEDALRTAQGHVAQSRSETIHYSMIVLSDGGGAHHHDLWARLDSSPQFVLELFETPKVSEAAT